MNSSNKSRPGSDRRFFYRYASLGTQLLAAIGLAVFAGLKLDAWLHSAPILAAVLPLLVLSVIFYKLFRETGRSKEDD